MRRGFSMWAIASGCAVGDIGSLFNALSPVAGEAADPGSCKRRNK